MHELEKRALIQQRNKHAWKGEFKELYNVDENGNDPEDEFGWNLNILKRTEFFSRFLYEDWFKAQAIGKKYSKQGSGGACRQSLWCIAD